jgi:transposase-like protein
MDISKLNQLWAGVKDYYVDWEQEAFAEPGRRALKQLLEGAMKAEVVGYLRRQKYERGKVVVDYRNGYYHRNLVTSLGLIPRLMVPRTRKLGCRTKVFRRYQRPWQCYIRMYRGSVVGSTSYGT